MEEEEVDDDEEEEIANKTRSPISSGVLRGVWGVQPSPEIPKF
jgi:hypothetical protein